MREAIESIRVLGLRRYLYSRFLYRSVSRLAHRYNWHHIEKSVIEGGDILEWCHWCGIRSVTKATTPQRIVSELKAAKEAAC